jgi:hypothetical protein
MEVIGIEMNERERRNKVKVSEREKTRRLSGHKKPESRSPGGSQFRAVCERTSRSFVVADIVLYLFLVK